MEGSYSKQTVGLLPQFHRPFGVFSLWGTRRVIWRLSDVTSQARETVLTAAKQPKCHCKTTAELHSPVNTLPGRGRWPPANLGSLPPGRCLWTSEAIRKTNRCCWRARCGCVVVSPSPFASQLACFFAEVCASLPGYAAIEPVRSLSSCRGCYFFW